MVKLKSVDSWIKEKCKDPKFKKDYDLAVQKANLIKPIIKFRFDHEMNQNQLAKFVGVSQQQISLIEKGKFSNFNTIHKVLLAIGYHMTCDVVEFTDFEKKSLELANI